MLCTTPAVSVLFLIAYSSWKLWIFSVFVKFFSTHITSPVHDWIKPCVSHCAGITTQIVVQHNYHNCAISSVLHWCWGCSYSTHPCNYDCIPTCRWYNTPVVIKTTHAWTSTALATHTWSYILVTTLRTMSGHGPKSRMDLDLRYKNE